MSPSYRLQMDLLTHRLVLSYQGCHPSLKMPICVVFTPKTGWFWMMSDTEVTSRWLSKGSRLLPSPPLRSLARTIPSRPCSLLSSCCGVTRPMCPSLLVDWLTHEVREAEQEGVELRDMTSWNRIKGSNMGTRGHAAKVHALIVLYYRHGRSATQYCFRSTFMWTCEQ